MNVEVILSLKILTQVNPFQELTLLYEHMAGNKQLAKVSVECG